MHRIVLTASLLVVVLVAACGGAGTPTPSSPLEPSPSPSAPVPTDPSSEPTVAPSDAPSAPATPTPTPPAPAEPTAEEQYLIDGVRRGGQDCRPVRADLPSGAVAGIECTADDPAVARLGFYLFPDETSMLDAYFERMASEGITEESGGCIDGEGEGSYVPYEGVSPYRDGCFINAEGYANYRATLPGANVYVGILGRTDDMAALAAFAWVGNQDTPGNPTLWAEPDR
jgi:hypothetical protein